MSNSEQKMWSHYDEDRLDGGLADEEYQQYFEAVAKIEDFDVPHFAHAVVQGLIALVFNLEIYGDMLGRSGALAIEHYNEQNGTDFEIVEFVKLNVGVVQGLDYYMTFKLKVYNGIDETEVFICRKLVPSP